MSTGFFLVVEGPEGAGKTTLVAALAERLRASGADPLLVREPGGTPVGERIRALLLDPASTIEPASELFLFLAARADLVARVIGPALAAGSIILADRFQLSTEAYQCGGRGLDREVFRLANRAATGGLDPGLTLVLDIPVELGFTRRQKTGQGLDRIELAGREFHERVGAVFRSATGPGVVHLDAMLPPERVLHAAWQEVEQRLPAARGGSRH
jgi:dTMP kinase